MLVWPPKSHTWNLMFLYVTVSTLNPIAEELGSENVCMCVCVCVSVCVCCVWHVFQNPLCSQCVQYKAFILRLRSLGMVATISPTCKRSANERRSEAKVNGLTDRACRFLAFLKICLHTQRCERIRDAYEIALLIRSPHIGWSFSLRCPGLKQGSVLPCPQTSSATCSSKAPSLLV